MHIFNLLVILSMVVAFVSFYIAVQHREAPKTLYYILLAVSICFYVLGYYLEANATTLHEAVQATAVEYIGLPFVPIFGLWFLMDCYEIPIRKWMKWTMLPLAILTTVLVATWQWNGVYYASVEFYPGPPLAQLRVQGSWYYYLYFTAFFAMLFAMVALSIYQMTKRPKGQRKIEILNTIAILLPVVYSALYFFDLTPYEYDFNPIIMPITLLLLSYSIFKLNLIKVLPLAKDVILEKMKDAFIIVDNDKHYLDSNRAAKDLFPSLAKARFGQPLSEISGLPYQDIDDLLESGKEFLLEKEQTIRYYRISSSEVRQQNQKMCTCIVLYDVTETKQLMEELHQLATYDSLTEIYNRGTFLQMAGLEFEQARTGDIPLVVMMFDVDRFKKVNDTYGHLCGDMVLHEIVDRLKSRFRQSDIFGRYGGEEFCACLSAISMEHAMNLAENLRKNIEETPFLWEDVSFAITLSIGVAQFDREHHRNLQMLLSDSDEALYKAKTNGRNQVVKNG